LPLSFVRLLPCPPISSPFPYTTLFRSGFLFFLSLPLWHIELFNFLLIPFFIFCALIFLHSMSVNKKITVSLLSVAASFIQLTAYIGREHVCTPVTVLSRTPSSA